MEGPHSPQETECQGHGSPASGERIDPSRWPRGGGITDLKKYLLKNRRTQFAKAFTRKLLTYALGRSLELTDEQAVEELTREFIESDYRIGNLIQLVVASDPFQSK